MTDETLRKMLSEMSHVWKTESAFMSWLELAELYFSCLYMRGYQDNTTFKSLLDKYGVDYD